ncbi:MAG: hypothetical protein ABFD13_06655 [Candidatus Cryosericum sp.]|nr:hypothetical protein [bacterium]
MKHVGRAVGAILVVFVVAVVWYAVAGEGVVTQHLFTNGAGIAAGTAWVGSDKGLDGGPVTAIARLPMNGAPVFAGTNEDDIFVSMDEGHTWSSVNATSSGHYVAGIEIDPRAAGRILGKAVYGAGFFLSDDGGRTWKNADRGLASRLLSCLTAPADAPDVLFAGTEDAGLFVSRDGGRSWRRTGGQALGSYVTAVNATRDGKTVYVATQEAGLSVSRDGGGTWTAISLPFGAEPVVTGIAIHPTDELRLAVAVTGHGISVSADEGWSWTTSRAGSLPSDCSVLQFLADGSSGLVAGTQSGALFLSDDGVEWQPAFQIESDGCVFGLMQSGSGLLAATSQGVFASSDGHAWSASSTGITNVTLRDLASSPADASMLFTATDQGVFRSQDAGVSWESCSEPRQILSILVMQDGPTVLAGTSNGSVLRSADGRDHWAVMTRGIPGVKVSTLVSPASDPKIVYAGTDNGCAVSTDAGLTWESRNLGLVPTASGESMTPRLEISAIFPYPDVPGRAILSLLGQGLYVTIDEGRHWQPLSASSDTQWIVCLAGDQRTGRLYAGTAANRVLVSSDGGVTWSSSGSGLSSILSVPGSVNAIAVAGDTTVYVGTQQRGVAVSKDGGGTWQRLNSGLPDLSICAIGIAGDSVFAMTSHRLVRLQTQ